MKCHICETPTFLFFENGRRFFRCPRCWLLFSPDAATKCEEERHYKGQWGLAEPETWDQKAEVLMNLMLRYRVPRSILDFGSGCGSLTRAFQRRGIPTTPLEPMINGYLKDQSFPHRFDAVVSVEVIEHLPQVWPELRELEKVLAPDGLMVFSTLLTNDFIELPNAVEHFKSWWYKDDPTHVNFFCNKTLETLAAKGPYQIDVFGHNLFVLRRGL